MALAIVIAACEASTPSGPPLADPDITPSVTTAGEATPAPTSCPLDGGSAKALQAVIELAGPNSREDADIGLESVTRLGDGGSVYESPPDTEARDAGWVIGGQPLALSFELRPMALRGVALTDLSALYDSPGNGVWAPVHVEALGNGGTVAIPDASGSAQLRLAVTWTDGCFEYVGSVRFTFEVVPAAVVAACPSDVEGLGDILLAHEDDRVVIGGASRPIGTLLYSARYSPYDSAGHVDPFGSWDPAAEGVDASAGELLEATDDDADLRLTGADARFYLRTDPNSTSIDGLVEESATALEADESGRLLIVSPTTAGSYVLELSTHWELDCLTGGGLAYFSVEVGSPVGGLLRPSV